MEFGRLPSVDSVDFTLPVPEPCSGAAWGRPRGSGSACDVRLGMASWGDPGLSRRLGGSVTPGGTVKQGLRSYSLAMPSIELNSTFHGFSRQRFEDWRAQVPRGFRFHAKLPRTITHDLGLGRSEAEMARFVGATEVLGEARGCLWFALPPYVGPSEFQTLRSFLKRWRASVPLAVEVREAGWFRGAALRDLVAMLADHDTTFIITDAAGRRDVLHMRLTAPRTMIRFVANGLHPTDFTRLDDWCQVLRAWADAGLESARFFFHQRVEAQTVDLADHMEARLSDQGMECLGPWRERTGFGAAGTQLDLFGASAHRLSSGPQRGASQRFTSPADRTPPKRLR